MPRKRKSTTTQNGAENEDQAAAKRPVHQETQAERLIQLNAAGFFQMK
jgi:hypothetical protein